MYIIAVANPDTITCPFSRGNLVKYLIGVVSRIAASGMGVNAVK
jgi:hypothetical protein